MDALTPDQIQSLRRLHFLFAALPDRRQPGKVAYPLDEVFMMALAPDPIVAILNQWASEFGGHHIAIDGKALRGSRDSAAGRSHLHLVRAWVDARGLGAGQVTCAQKSNEVEAIPRLLDSLVLEGAVVTIDAAGTPCAIAGQIHEAGADYVLSLKANQKHALGAVATWFADAPEEDVQRVVTPEHRPGRCERREHSMSGNLT